MEACTAFTHHLCRVDVDDALKPTEEQLETIPDRPQEIKRQRLFLG